MTTRTMSMICVTPTMRVTLVVAAVLLPCAGAWPCAVPTKDGKRGISRVGVMAGLVRGRGRD